MNKRLLLFTVAYILTCVIVDSQGDTGECHIRHSHSGASTVLWRSIRFMLGPLVCMHVVDPTPGTTQWSVRPDFVRKSVYMS